ncbi:MAG TPA: homoserine dehydrogenase, partial [Opitutaceae bacterium]|nr:homoserine dehydrogenase [Opitutaceae bacterium]
MSKPPIINIGLCGLGTVGQGVWKHLSRARAELESRLGVQLVLHRAAVRDLKKARAVKIPAAKLTTDALAVATDPSVHIVCELIGGTGLAREVTLAALRQGKIVVSANKALLCGHGAEIFSTARKHGGHFLFEASVAGGIPIIKALREGLIANRFKLIYGILNGTCNYILTRMKLEGAEFADVLADAQRLGYAEAEPSLDIDGFDSEHKIGILASLAHGFWVRPKDIFVAGIRNISKLDMQFAGQLGYTIKLLGIVKQADGGKSSRSRVQVSVYPALVPNAHVLANVNHVFNAVFVRGDVVGDTLFYGRGAGKDATASAVLSDVADAALDLNYGSKGRVPAFVPHKHAGSVLPIGEAVSRYYVRFSVV